MAESERKSELVARIEFFKGSKDINGQYILPVHHVVVLCASCHACVIVSLKHLRDPDIVVRCSNTGMGCTPKLS